MGYAATAIVGIPLGSLLRKEEIVTHVTKYDPDTGKPYQKENLELKWWLGNLELPDEPVRDFLEENQEKFGGLSTFRNIGHDEWIGIQIGNVDEYRGVSEISEKEFSAIWDKAEHEFSKLGYTGRVMVVLLMQGFF